jgi:hypothetical protein
VSPRIDKSNDQGPRGPARVAAGGPGPVPGAAFASPAKQYVLSCLFRLGRDGFVEWRALGNGDVELRFKTGETYILGDKVITRSA